MPAVLMRTKFALFPPPTVTTLTVGASTKSKLKDDSIEVCIV